MSHHDSTATARALDLGWTSAGLPYPQGARRKYISHGQLVRGRRVGQR